MSCDNSVEEALDEGRNLRAGAGSGFAAVIAMIHPHANEKPGDVSYIFWSLVPKRAAVLTLTTEAEVVCLMC